MVNQKSQVSMEYLAIIGFVVVVVAVLVTISMFYSKQVNDQVIINQVDRLAKELVDTSEKVYYWGPPSKITIKSYIPASVDSISIANNEIVFKVSTQHGSSDVAYKASVNITGAIDNSQGLRRILVESRDGFVLINGTLS